MHRILIVLTFKKKKTIYSRHIYSFFTKLGYHYFTCFCLKQFRINNHTQMYEKQSGYVI